LPRGKGSIDLELFYNILKEAGNNVNTVYLWGYGEPLMHPNICSLLNMSKKYSCYKILSTNGRKLHEFEDLGFLRTLDEIWISINGYTPATYKQHQVGGDINKVIKGVHRLREQLTDSSTILVLQTVAHKGNLMELHSAKDFGIRHGFDKVVIKSFNVMDGKENTFNKFVPIGTKYSRYKKKQTSRLPLSSGIENYPCETWMVINWDGSVNPCCWDYKESYVLGNVKESGVYGVWNSTKSHEHKGAIRSTQKIDICIDCSKRTTIDKYNLNKEIIIREKRK
jgi:radical SAM protein with 4Fe4S-binding SPASM domain